jgi:hypothetical protein
MCSVCDDSDWTEKYCKKPDAESVGLSDLLALRKRAEKAFELIQSWNDLFPNNKDEHVIVTLMSAISDAYKQGIKDALHKKQG